MRLQAHDELVLEAPKERAEAVPLEVGMGEDWLSAKGWRQPPFFSSFIAPLGLTPIARRVYP
jgi:hypothetical protein